MIKGSSGGRNQLGLRRSESGRPLRIPDDLRAAFDWSNVSEADGEKPMAGTDGIPICRLSHYLAEQAIRKCGAGRRDKGWARFEEEIGNINGMLGEGLKAATSRIWSWKLRSVLR